MSGRIRLFNRFAFARRVRAYMEAYDLSVREAAPTFGISPATLSRCANGKTPSVETYLRVERVLEPKS